MLDKLLGSKTREKVLRLYLSEPGARYYIREIERKLDLSISALRREMDNLFKLGFLREVPQEELVGLGRDEQEEKEIRMQKRKYYVINADFIFYPELKALFAKNKYLSRDALIKKLQGLGQIDLLVLSGSFVGIEDAKVDILIVGDVDRTALSKLIEGFEKELDGPIYWVLFSREEYENRKAIMDKFLFEVLQGKKIELINKLDNLESVEKIVNMLDQSLAPEKNINETENKKEEGDFTVRIIEDENVSSESE